MRLTADQAYAKYADRVFAAALRVCRDRADADDVTQDGTVTVWWRGRGVDITDKFEDGVCYVQLKDGGETKYLTVKYQNGYACSDTAYISPSAFNTWPASTEAG